MEVKPSIQSVPPVSWEMLEKSLGHPNVLIRQKAIELAGRYADARAVAALQTLVRDENPEIRATAAQSLVHAARLRHAETEAALAQVITSAADDELRVFLISHATPSGGTILLRAVIASLVDPAANIRHAAEMALREQGGSWMISDVATEMLPTIEGARSAFNAEVSAAASRWATQLQRAQLRRTMLDSGLATALALSRALQSPSPLMRAAAAEALWKTNDPRAVPALRDALRDPDETVRHTAALGLGALGWRPAGLEELIYWEVAIGRWGDVVTRGESALDAIVFAAGNSGPETQAKAIECIVALKSVRGMLQLVPLLDSPHRAVRRAAATALEALEWVAVNDVQAMRHSIELDDWHTVASYGAKALPPLISALKESHASQERRATIAAALQAITDPEAVEPLIRLCGDGEVSDAVVAALEAFLQRNAGSIAAESLRSILALTNVVQFKFKHDPGEDRLVRSGIDLVDLASLKAKSERELLRRGPSAATSAIAVTEAEAA